MANRVLSIEIGYSLTKVCEMDCGVKAPKIYNSFVLETPQGMLADGVVSVNENFIKAFQSILNEKKIKTRRTVFSIASSKIATREAKIPYCKPNRIPDVVRANLDEYFPVDASQYMISHSVLAIEGEENGQGSDTAKKKATVARPAGYKLLLLAVPRQLIESYQFLAKAMGLEIETIDYCGNSLFQAAKEECSDGTQLIIKVDERSSLLMVLKNGVIVLNRTIPYGIDEAVEVLKETTSLGEMTDYSQALHLARRKTCILSAFSEENETESESENEDEQNDLELRKDKMHVTLTLKSLTGGIARVIDYYNSNHSSEQIEKIYVTGVGADFSGLSTLLTNEIGFKIKNLTNLTGINIEKAFKEVSFGEYVACMGASIEPLSFYSDKIEERGSKAKKISYQKVSYLALTVCIVLGVVLIMTSLIPFIFEKKKKENYEQIIADLQPVYDIYTTYQQLTQQVNQLSILDDETRNRNEEIVSFIDVMEEKMPMSFCLNDIAATADGITMNVTVASKEEVATVLNELNKLTSFISADTTSVTELTTEIGEKQYSFSVELIYAPIEEETTEVEE